MNDKIIISRQEVSKNNDPIIEEMAKAVRKIADKHGIQVFMYSCKPTGTVSSEGNMTFDSNLMVRGMQPVAVGLLASHISNSVPSLRDLIVSGKFPPITGKDQPLETEVLH